MWCRSGFVSTVLLSLDLMIKVEDCGVDSVYNPRAEDVIAYLRLGLAGR